MSGGRQKATAAGAALIATVALIGAGCTTSTDDHCELGAYALAATPASKGGGTTDVKKPPPQKGSAPSARARTGNSKHHDDDCDDW